MTQIVLTTTGTNTWTIPSDFGSTNTIEVIGAGGNGYNGGSGGGLGGAGGGYGKIFNVSLTPGGSVSYTIATAGSAGDTFFNGTSFAIAPVGAHGGANGTQSGSVPTGGTGKGTTTYTGGNGGQVSGTIGGAGGGAAGPHGNGGNAVAVGSGGTGGAGDAGYGGAGGSYNGNGSNGTEYSSSPAYGSGGGAGAANSCTGGTYGAGGGGGITGDGSGAGSQGLIVINYTPQQFLTLTAAEGSFTLTGESVTITKSQNVSFATGHYTLTGNAVSFKYNGHYIFGVNTGYYVLTGENAALSIGVNNKIYAGIFSLMVSPSQVGNDTPGALVMESQYSYGLTPAFNSSQNGILIDNEQYANYDSYYSAWSNSNMGGIDFNDTTLWQNWEPLIETDLIPIGTILNKGTLGNIEFKLDRPMASGDQIRLSWRPNLTASYTVMGTTSTAQLSDYYPSNISQSQWAQFLVQFKCASSGSSFIPLREIRIHIT